ncbi:MAG: hypothetical protein ABWY81_10890 [Jiangellaceae bacterium]
MTEAVTTCTARPECPVPHDVWLGASFRLESPQPVTQPYPHICQGPNAVGYPERDCLACAA